MVRALLLALLLPALPALAQPADLVMTTCRFDGGAPITFTLIDENGRKSPSEQVRMVILTDDGAQLPAFAELVPRRRSPTGTPLIRLVSRADAVTAIAVEIDADGAATLFPYEWEGLRPIVPEGHPGSCPDARDIFRSWR